MDRAEIQRADPSGADADSRFTAIVTAFADRPTVTYGGGAPSSRRFGANALEVDGKIFAMLVKDRLVVKLSKTRVDALVAAGVGIPFDPGSGRVMREWVALGVDPEVDWEAVAAEALAFVTPGG